MGTLRLIAITGDDVAKMPYGLQRVYARKPGGSRYTAPRWRREAVPPPPDYSTPQAVTARCRERGTRESWLVASWAAEKDRTVAKAYRAFMEACGGWRDLHPLAPHLPGVGRTWGTKRVAAGLARIREGGR